MTITVKLFATFRDGRGKEVIFDLEPGTTIQDVIDKLAITKEELAIILVNGNSSTVDTELHQDDLVALFPPVGGG